MDFSPRLKQILFLLLNSKEPIPASTLAEQLQLSKRTIFREIEHVDAQLDKYHLHLHTKSKRGFYLVGEHADKTLLLEALNSTEDLDPLNRNERHKRLILALLKQDSPQKIYFYSDQLKVSEGTINNDLDIVEQWFLDSDIKLIRKPGLGIYLDYEEENYRKSCIRFIYQNMDIPNINKALENNEPLYALIEQDIVNKVIAATNEMNQGKINAMTEYSYLGFILYLSIMVTRILKKKEIQTPMLLSKQDMASDSYNFVLNIVSILKEQFHTAIGMHEISYLFIYIKGTKLQFIHESTEPTDQYFDLTCLIYKMIHQYDPAIAYQLKQDDILIKGLIAHLTPTLVRLQYNIEIHNPFQNEIKTLYPDILEKTNRAVKVMEDDLKRAVPEEETSLLALHFGGAAVRLQNTLKLHNKVNLGVICASGIGISTLLSSRISHIFHDQVRVKTLAFSDLIPNPPGDIDLLISTFDLPSHYDRYIRVNPMLTERDVELISAQIEAVFASTNTETNIITKNVMDQVEEIGLISNEIGSLLESFHVYHVDPSIHLNDLILYVSRLLGDSQTDQSSIYEDLLKREAISTQVIPEYEFVLLHSKTSGVRNSKFIVLVPQAPSFSDPYFMQTKAVVVMLIPPQDPRDTLAIASISSAIFEADNFLDSIKNGDESRIKAFIEHRLKQYLLERISDIQT